MKPFLSLPEHVTEAALPIFRERFNLKNLSATILNKRAVLLHLPAYKTDEEQQNIDTVSFFMRLHRDVG